jgi:hypothetical protein
MVLLLLLGSVISASAVPVVDNPETVFNELDAPVNLAPSALPRIRLAPPVADSTALPKLPLCCRASLAKDFPRELPPRAMLYHPYSVQTLFCSFLI